MSEPVAVVGLACRLPQANDPDELWRLLTEGTSAITAFPADRIGAWEGDPAELAPAGFLDSVDLFDADLFEVGPREAVAMDPQQRLALEVAWEGLERSGIDASSLRGRPVGVFLGMMNGDYADVAAATADAAVTRHSMTGLGRSIAANRISHTFGLTGPSLVVDSGQSSSLVAVHMACESLRGGESTVALAGGVSLILSPLSSLRAAAVGALSPDATAYVFDARANGFVRGEGAGLVVLKLLSEAVADGDYIHGVIDGSAVSSGTGDEGLMAPRAEAQEHVIAAALERSGVDPKGVGYVELHGTGTPAGDPVEAAALGSVYGVALDAGHPLAVGSIKTNFGHLEGAAGIAGLLKTLQCVERRELVPSLNFAEPNPRIALDDLHLRVVTAVEPWPGDGRAMAATSSFGMGGTNCHVVVSAAPERSAPRQRKPAAPPALAWVLSGQSEPALRAQAERLHDHVDEHPDLDPADVAWTLASARARLPHRAIAVGSDRAALIDGVAAIAAGRPAAGVARGVAGAARKVAFVFPGQGSQWAGMGLELWDAAPAFAREMEACAEALAPFVDWSLRDVLGDADALARIEVVQPALFAMMVSLAGLWRSFGVEPAAVVGHSQGESAAAYVAGALSLEDAARIAALRSQALVSIAGGSGGLASVLASAADVEALLARWEGRVGIAAYNGPSSTTVTGDIEALTELVQACEDAGLRARLVPAAVASHSHYVEPLRDQLLADLEPLSPHAGEVTFYSAVDNAIRDGAELDGDYCYRGLRQPVLFEQTIRSMLADGVTAFIEMSPHPVLVNGLDEVVGESGDGVALSSLRRDDGGMPRAFMSLAEAHANGVDVDWGSALGEDGPARVQLPTYAFQRRRFWAGDDPESAAPVEAGPGLQAGATLDVVLEQAAAVLGHESAAAVSAKRAFRDMGFDSLAGVELRNRLTQITGLRLPSTLVFDHPTPTAVADLIAARLGGDETAARAVVRARPAIDEPIAIVGIGCRYPGGVECADDLWDLVAAGRDAIGEFPTDRGWDLDRLYGDDRDAPGTTYTRAGGFLDRAGDFDAAFFGIAPREAMAIDPQQRLLLETAWEALEHAGIDPTTLAGTQSAVFAGISSQDYASFQPGGDPALEGLQLTGALTSVISGRIAYSLGLQGPAVTVDTACSASLVALHLAGQALRSGECSLALAGGVTVLATPGMFVEFARQRGLAPDGRCKSFAAAADGTGWGEGAGMLVLERLSDAQRLGHRPLALLLGTATNQDGASNGLTAPNGPSQEQVIRQALANADVAADDVDAVEAHGTGTTLGDPIEAQALLATYGRDREGSPLRLGSIKSNIGHTQGAAGVAGVIKMVMALREEQLPATLHVDEPTPDVDWESGAVDLLTESVAWPRSDRPRRAAVSSFGISGTNAHIVLGEAPAEAAVEARPTGPVPWILSARTEPALRAQARRLADHLDARPDLDPVDVGWTLAAGRAALEHRAVLVGDSRDPLRTGLGALAAGEPGVTTGVARGGRRVAFVFPGQGSQWPGMGLGLWDTSPVFAREMDACAEALSPFVDWSLREALADAEALERVDVVQPALFAMMVSLAGLWRSYGVEPAAVVGHSQGEIAAAHVAGALSLEDAARVAALRSQALAQIAGAGGMASVSLAADELRERLGQNGGGLAIAAYNGPRSMVVAGSPAELDALIADCEAEGVRGSRIAVNYASHSDHVEEIRERLLADLAPIEPVAATTPIISTKTGEAIDGALLGAEHWYESLREPVLFEQATRVLLDENVTVFIETSAHPVLTWPLRETVDGTGTVAVISSLRREEGTVARMLTSLGEAHVEGVEVDWDVAFAGTGARRAELPTYPFERTRFWLDPSARAGAGRGAAPGAIDHPLLEAAVPVAGRDAWLLTGRISLSDHPWLADHAVEDTVLLPGTAFLELAFRAAEQAGCAGVDELTLELPLLLGDAAVELQVSVDDPDAAGRRGIEIHARAGDGDWVRHASGSVVPAADSPAADLGEWPPPGADPIDVDELYDRLSDIGFGYGPAFRGVRAAWRTGDDVFTEVGLAEPEANAAAGYGLHPALLDAALHPAIAAPGDDTVRLPFRWAGVAAGRTGATSLRVRVGRPRDGVLLVAAADEAGATVLAAELATQPLGPGGLRGDTGPDGLFRVTWSPAGADPERIDGEPVDAPADVAGALELVQRRLEDETAASLVLVTRGAMAVREGEAADPGAAAVWGLVRSAQTEHPGRFVLVDADVPAAELAVLPPDEQQVSIRDGELLVPRLVRARPAPAMPEDPWRLVKGEGDSFDDVEPQRAMPIALSPLRRSASPCVPRESTSATCSSPSESCRPATRSASRRAG